MADGGYSEALPRFRIEKRTLAKIAKIAKVRQNPYGLRFAFSDLGDLCDLGERSSFHPDKGKHSVALNPPSGEGSSRSCPP